RSDLQARGARPPAPTHRGPRARRRQALGASRPERLDDALLRPSPRAPPRAGGRPRLRQGPEMNSPGVSFVIPAFNEEAAIPVVLESIQRIAKERRLQAECIVVDDGSTDQTAAVAASHGARVISIPMNVGY